jgi:hypothetical protein
VALWHPSKLKKPLSTVSGPSPVTCVAWSACLVVVAVVAADKAGGVVVFAIY